MSPRKIRLKPLYPTRRPMSEVDRNHYISRLCNIFLIILKFTKFSKNSTPSWGVPSNFSLFFYKNRLFLANWTLVQPGTLEYVRGKLFTSFFFLFFRKTLFSGSLITTLYWDSDSQIFFGNRSTNDYSKIKRFFLETSVRPPSFQKILMTGLENYFQKSKNFTPNLAITFNEHFHELDSNFSIRNFFKIFFKMHKIVL